LERAKFSKDMIDLFVANVQRQILDVSNSTVRRQMEQLRKQEAALTKLLENAPDVTTNERSFISFMTKNGKTMDALKKGLDKCIEEVQALATAGKIDLKTIESGSAIETASETSIIVLQLIAIYTCVVMIRNPQVRLAEHKHQRTMLEEVLGQFNMEGWPYLEGIFAEAHDILGKNIVNAPLAEHAEVPSTAAGAAVPPAIPASIAKVVKPANAKEKPVKASRGGGARSSRGRGRGRGGRGRAGVHWAKGALSTAAADGEGAENGDGEVGQDSELSSIVAMKVVLQHEEVAVSSASDSDSGGDAEIMGALDAALQEGIELQAELDACALPPKKKKQKS
jgi:hypothetical protein